jgi:hypothetical protein
LHAASAACTHGRLIVVLNGHKFDHHVVVVNETASSVPSIDFSLPTMYHRGNNMSTRK